MKNIVAFMTALGIIGGISHPVLAGGANATATSDSESNAIAVANSQGVGKQTQGQTVHIDDHSHVDAKPAIAPNLGGLAATPYTCMGSSQVTVGANGIFALGLGTTWRDKECDKREAIKISMQMGERELAYKLLYNLDVVKELMQENRNNRQNNHEVSGKNCVEKQTIFGSTYMECDE